MTAGRMQFNRWILTALSLVLAPGAAAADCPGSRGPRAGLMAGAYAAGETAAIVLRHDAWWRPPRRSFHASWGGSPSKEQDGLLHAAITYQATQVADIAWRWACVPAPAAAWLAAATGFALGLPKEIGDGLHQNGFSGTDLTYSALGALLPALRRTWAPARMVQLKAYYWPSNEFRNRVGPLPELENDYAGQRYYLSVNPGRAGRAAAWPRWLGVALGHSVPAWASLPPTHVWFVTLDLDLAGLPVKAKWWKSVASVLDQVHIPMPGIRLSRGATTAGMY